MREILFRGKRVDTGGWVYGDIAHIEDRVFISYYNNCELKQFINDEVTSNNITLVGIFPFVEVIPESVGQYIGVNIDFTKIFEGDVVTFVEDGIRGDFRKGVAEVWWNKKIANFCLKTKSGSFSSKFNAKKVIGNVHDNPELLEVK